MVLIFKVSNDSDKYLPRHRIIKDCSESYVHHIMSQILSILIDFIQGHPFLVQLFWYFFKSSDLDNSRTQKDIKKWKTATFLTFKGLSDKTINIFMSFAL